MEIDRATIKAISADTRLAMLKSLSKRKKMPSELSREIGLSPSTIVGHLQNLETAGLIKRIETGHKWVYYELTDKGTSIVRPAVPVQFALSLALGIIMISFGALKFLYPETLFASIQKSGALQAAIQGARESASSGNAIDTGTEIIASGAAIDWLSIIILVIGASLIIFSIYRLKKRAV